MNNINITKQAMIIHITSGIIGIWSGILIMLGLWEAIWLLTPRSYTDCSGLPCSTSEFLIPIILATIGGITGGIVSYSILQRLSHQPIYLRPLLFSGLIGAMLWPVVGLAWFLVLTIVPFSLKGTIDFILVSGTILTSLGVIIGALFGLFYSRSAE